MKKTIKSLIFAELFTILLLGPTNNSYSWPRLSLIVRPRLIEVVTFRPEPDFIWIKGHFKYNVFGNAVWVPGHWRRI